MKYLEDVEKQTFIFLTLTVPNCSGSELSNVLTEMNNAFRNKFAKYSKFENCVNGYVKKVEITYNSKQSSKSYNTYHPHFHILLSVNQSYFDDKRLYVKHSDWLQMWQKAMKDTSISQVNVKRANKKAVLEMSKYMAKDSQYLHSKEVFATFYNSLKGRQLITYAGNCNEVKKLFEAGKLQGSDEDSNYIITDSYNVSCWNMEISNYDNTKIELNKLDEPQIQELKKILKSKRYTLQEYDETKFIVKRLKTMSKTEESRGNYKGEQSELNLPL